MEYFTIVRIIHFSSSSVGGAGIAALRLHESLLEAGFESNFITLNLDGNFTRKNTFELHRKTLKRTLSRVLTFISLKFSTKIFFSPISINQLKLKSFLCNYNQDTTVFHFHNIYNLTNTSFINQLTDRGYKVVITLHDERYFTAGCHYAFECQGFKSGCKACPMVPSLVGKFPAILNTPLAINGNSPWLIAPSKWLLNQLLQSNLKDFRATWVPNVLIPDSNLPIPSKIKNGHLLIVGVSSFDIFSYVKGGDLIRDLSAKVQEELGIKVVYMVDYRNKSDFWTDIDVLLAPSRADNSPNVIHEAKSFGIPCIASPIGGVLELLELRCDVPLDGIDLESFKKALLNFEALGSRNANTQNSKIIRKSWEKYCSGNLTTHIKIYQEILGVNE
jgi:glycosyltransferase involved in cell wall biosynthesis